MREYKHEHEKFPMSHSKSQLANVLQRGFDEFISPFKGEGRFDAQELLANTSKYFMML